MTTTSAPIRIAKHPFHSPESHVLTVALDAELDALYPDWDELTHPGREDKVPSNFQVNADGTVAPASSVSTAAPPTFLVAFASPSPEQSASTASIPEPHSDLAGCAAIVPLPTTPIEGLVLPPAARAAEIKRVYVSPAVRKRGVSQALLVAAEAEARAQGFGVLVLETGVRQIGALKLYDRNGWRRCPMYGIYIGSGTDKGGVSVCYRKDLDHDPVA